MIAYPSLAAPATSAGSPAMTPAFVVNEGMRQQAAALLQHTYRWLDSALPVAPQLSTMVPPLITAVQLYQAQQYGACLNQMFAVTSALRQARWAFPILPPL